MAHDTVAEAAVVGRPDDLKGQAISAFVTLEKGQKPSTELKEELRKWVAKEIGALAKPDDIRFTDMLPKTRSGKIMRRLLARTGDQRGRERRHHDARGFGRDCQVEGERGGVSGIADRGDVGLFFRFDPVGDLVVLGLRQDAPV